MSNATNNVQNSVLEEKVNIDNSKLEEAFNNFLEAKTVINQQMLVSELLQSKVIVPIALNGEVEKEGYNFLINKDTDIRLILLSNENDEKFCPAFISNQELSKFPQERSGCLIKDFVALAKMVIKKDSGIDGIVVNPFGNSLTLNNELLTKMIAPELEKVNSKNYTIEKGQKVLVGEPKVYPEKAVEIMKAVFSNHHCVHKAYLRLLVRPDAPKDNNMSYLVVVESVDHDPEHMFEDVAKLTKDFLDGIPLDFVQYKEDSSFVKNAIKGCKPFYAKKKNLFGIFSSNK